jgi:hypothetical protein
MRPVDGVATTANTWSLGDDGRNYFVYAPNTPAELSLRLPTAGRYTVRWLNPDTGKVQAEESNTAGPDLSLSPKTNVLWLSIQR